MDKPIFLPKWFLAALEDESMRGKAGEAGRSVDKLVLSDNKVIVHFSDGHTECAGEIETLQGPCGEKGERGINGNDGSIGVDGRDGLPGTNGADGRDGERGLRGVAGEDGSNGIDGTNGEVGLAGAKGDKGERGKAPKHQIDLAKGRIRFERPDGGWGAWVQIKQEIRHEVVNTGGGGGGAQMTQAIQDIKGLLVNSNVALYALGTGLIDITLPGVTKLTNTTARVHAGSGYFLDLSTPIEPKITYTTWLQQDFTDAYVSTALRTYLAIDSTGTVTQFNSSVTAAQRRTYIPVGVLTHIDGATITQTNLLPATVRDMAGKMHDLCEAISFVNLEGNVYDGASTTLNTLNVTAGKSFACDRNFASDKDSPNVTIQTAVDPITGFFVGYDDGSGGPTIELATAIDSTVYDDLTGTKGTLPAGYWVTHRVFRSTTTGSTLVLLGQAIHRGRTEAIVQISTEQFKQIPGAEELLLRGYLTIRSGAAGLQDRSTSVFTPANRFGEVPENRDTNGFSLGIPIFKSEAFTSRGVTAGTYYMFGDYSAPATKITLTNASLTLAYGTANAAYGMRPIAVFAGDGTVDTGQVGLRVTGTTVTDGGVRTASDTQVITTDITAPALNEYLEPEKKFVGTVTYELYVVSGSPTAYSVSFNYGLAKYEDFGNRDFMITDLEVRGLGGATDTAAEIILLKHTTTGWTYSAAAFVPGDGEITSLNAVYGTEDNIINGEQFNFKLDSTALSVPILGASSEGLIVRVVATANNTFQTLNINLGVQL